MQNYRHDLAFGNDFCDELFNKYYENYFGYYSKVSQIETVKDKPRQLLGIDKVIHLADGRKYTLDEKKRDFSGRFYPHDILIETISNLEEGKLGWLYRDTCDYICYAKFDRRGKRKEIPAQEQFNKADIYMLDMKLLRDTWVANKEVWEVEANKRISSTGYGQKILYHTINYAIQAKELIYAMEQHKHEIGGYINE